MIPWPKTPWNEIIPNLWQGGLHYQADPNDWDVEDAYPYDEFQLVVSLHPKLGFEPTPPIPEWRGRIPDGVLDNEDRRRVNEAVTATLAALEDGKRVLVRCQAGYNRSGLVVALVLLAKGWTADEAIAHIRRQRSEWALCNEHFVGYIRERAGAEARR